MCCSSFSKRVRNLACAVAASSLFLSVVSCGGDGGEIPPSPATPQAIVSGSVQAPNGQVVFHQPGIGDVFETLFMSSAYASLSGLSPVPDGTSVQLGRIDSTGAFTILSATNVSGGRYSFNLTSLGLTFASDLVVRVTNGSVQMRAFVVDKTANLDPVSETAVRMILEQIAIPPGTPLGQLTPQELRDFVGSLDLLTTTNQTAAGLTIEATITAIKQRATADAGLMAFLTAAAGVGDTTEGPGDIGNYFSFTQGNVWKFQGTKSGTGQPTVNFVNTITITGAKPVGGVTATVFTETNSDGAGQEEESYLFKDSRGITNHGSNDASDPLTPQLIPFRMLRFPLQQDSTFESVDKKGVNFGDLDGDGKNELGNVLVQITVVAFETLTMPAGTFTNSAKIEARIASTVTLSSNKAKVTVTETQTNWLAPGVGPVKRMSVAQGGGITETITEELVGYVVNGQAKGTIPITLATGVATADPNENSPGRSGLASDGTKYLLVSCRTLGSPTGLFGVFVSSGVPGQPFPIASGDCLSNLGHPAVAFNGTNYLVVFVKNGIIRGTRVSPSGTILDGQEGFAISIGTPTLITNSTPTVAADGTNYLVMWNKFTSGHDIYGATVTSTGTVSAEFPVSTASGDQVLPSLAFNGTNYLAVWSDDRNSSTDVFGARITPGRTVLDPFGIAIATTSSIEEGPRIAFDGMNYLVVWRRVLIPGIDPSPAEIRGARIKQDGTLLDGIPSDGGIGINTAVLGKSNPAVAFDGTNFFVAWIVGAFLNNPPAGVFGARVSPSGQVVEGEPTGTGISLSDAPPPFTRYRFPVISSNGVSTLLTWINNVELAGQTKSIMGTLIVP